MKKLILAALAVFSLTAPASAALVVSAFEVSAGIALYGPFTTLIDWDRVTPQSGTTGTDPVTGNSVSAPNGLAIVLPPSYPGSPSWIEGEGFDNGTGLSGSQALDLAVNGVENFTLNFVAPIRRLAFAVSTGVGNVSSEVRTTPTAFNLTSTAGTTSFSLSETGTYWITVTGDTPFSSLTFTENDPTAVNPTIENPDNSIYDQYFGDFVTSVPEPATWMMLMLGFGLIGYAMRSRNGRGAVSFA